MKPSCHWAPRWPIKHLNQSRTHWTPSRRKSKGKWKYMRSRSKWWHSRCSWFGVCLILNQNFQSIVERIFYEGYRGDSLKTLQLSSPNWRNFFTICNPTRWSKGEILQIPLNLQFGNTMLHSDLRWLNHMPCSANPTLDAIYWVEIDAGQGRSMWRAKFEHPGCSSLVWSYSEPESIKSETHVE